MFSICMIVFLMQFMGIYETYMERQSASQNQSFHVVIVKNNVLLTRDNMLRRMNGDDTCCFFPQLESIDHLFLLHAPFLDWCEDVWPKMYKHRLHS